MKSVVIPFDGIEKAQDAMDTLEGGRVTGKVVVCL
jgi:hypothetical protein